MNHSVEEEREGLAVWTSPFLSTVLFHQLCICSNDQESTY
jgi:hypothetical protein